MSKRKNIILFLAVLMFFLFSPTRVYAGAGDNTDFSVDNEKNINIEITVPDGFSEDVVVYFGDIPRYMNSESNYKLNTVLTEGSYAVKALVPSDLNNDFQFIGPSVFSTDDKTIKYTLYYTGEDYVEGDHEGLEFESVEVNASEIDYSKGNANSGILVASSESYSAVKVAVYILQNTTTKEYYEVRLTSDNCFESKIKLPEGKYIESPSMDVTLDKDAKSPAGLHIVWSHAKDTFTFGNVYEVKAGETLELPILYLVVTVDGQTFEEFNSKAFFQATLEKNLNKAHENHINEVLDNDVKNETVTETVSYTGFEKEVEEEKNSISIFFIIALILAIVVVVYFIINRHKKKRENEETNQYNDDDEDF